MKKTFLRFGALFLILCMMLTVFSGCSCGIRSILQYQFDVMLDQTLVGMVSQSEFSYKNVFRDPERYGLSYTTYQLIDPSILEQTTKEDVKLRKDELEQAIEELEAISPISLRKDQRPAYYAMLDYMKTELAYVGTPDYTSLFAPSGGFIAGMGIGFYEYPFDCEEDIQHYLKFLQNVPQALETVVTYTEMQEETAGYVMTAYVTDANSEYLNNYADEKNSPFLEGFVDKVEGADFLDDAAKQRYIDENEEIFTSVLEPAFEDLIWTLRNWKRGKAVPMYQYEDGKRYYEYLLTNASGTDMTPEEMLVYLEEKLDHYLLVISQSSKADIEKYVAGDYSIDARSPLQVVELLQRCTAEHLPAFEDPDCTLTDLPESLSVSGMLAYYLIPQADGEGKNIVRLNRDQLGSGNQAAMYIDTIAHESYPGHLYQINYWRQNGIHPMISWMNFIAATEGWADFISRRSLVWAGIPQGIADLINADYLASQILSAIADIQVNYMEMSREELNEYISEMMSVDPDLALFDSVYDAVIADPCAIIPYAMGFLQVTDLEQEVKDALGTQYDEKMFYEAYLNAGACSFASIRKQVLAELDIA